MKTLLPPAPLRLLACARCALWASADVPTEQERAARHGPDYFDGWDRTPQTRASIDAMKRRTFERAFDRIAAHARPGRLLDVGCAFGASLEVAASRGWDAHGIEISPRALAIARVRFGARILEEPFESARLEPAGFRAVLMWDVLEHLEHPREAIEKAHRLLEPRGLLIINTPSTRSLSARLLGGWWPQLKPEHLWYLSPNSARWMCAESGFDCLHLAAGVKALSPRYAQGVLRAYPVPGLSLCSRLICAALPAALAQRSVFVKTGELFLIARRRA